MRRSSGWQARDLDGAAAQMARRNEAILVRRRVRQMLIGASETIVAYEVRYSAACRLYVIDGEGSGCGKEGVTGYTGKDVAARDSGSGSEKVLRDETCRGWGGPGSSARVL